MNKEINDNPVTGQTIAGIRWEILISGKADTSITYFDWAIAIEREGNSLKTPDHSSTNRSAIFHPEQNVIAWGTGAVLQEDKEGGTQLFSGTTKSMRKLQSGDKVRFYFQAGHSVNVNAMFQYFILT